MPITPPTDPPVPIDPQLTIVDFVPALWEAGTTNHFCRNGTDDTVEGSVVPTPPTATDPTGRYLVGGEIGRGGVGVVHAGWDIQLKREIAVKVLLEEHKGKPSVVRRFLEEARITSRLSHPGIVPIHELGMSPDDRPFFVMRLVHGQTLEQILQRRTDVLCDLPLLLNIFLQICQAVAFAHSKGVIHRDLKPANIMVGAFGVVKVMDWGLAKVLGEIEPPEPIAAPSELTSQPTIPINPTLTETLIGTVFGTPAYLAPEQARGENDRVDKRADVFGLGSILCEILTGLPPYTGIDGREVYEKAAHANTADTLLRLNACLAPLDPVTLAKWCLSPDLLDRPADAANVVEVMMAHLHCEQRRAEQDLVRFFDLSLDLFCIASMEGYFIRVNDNFHRILGYTFEEMTTHPFLDFVHPDDRDRTILVVAKLNCGEPCVQFLNRYRHIHGHYLWFEWSTQAVLEERTLYAVARDVTERIRQADAHRRAEQSRFHLAAVVDSADVAIYSTSLDSIIQSWNPGAERLFGYRADEVIGRSLLLLFVPGGAGEESEILNHLKQSEQIAHYETVRVHKDGTAIPISLTVSTVKDESGTIVGTSRISRGIGDRKKAEAEAAERLRLAAFVSATAAALTRGVSLKDSLQNFVELAVGHLAVAFARVWTLNESTATLELQASAGLYTHLDGPHSRIPVGKFKIGRMAQDRKPHRTNAVVGDPQVSDQDWAIREGMVAFAGHPLIIDDRVVGVMAVFARRTLSDDILETLHSVSDSLALGIRRQQLEDEVRELRAGIIRRDNYR